MTDAADSTPSRPVGSEAGSGTRKGAIVLAVLIVTSLGLYIVGYIADDSLMVAVAVIALGSGKLTERTGRWLKLLSGVVMLALGGALLFRPEWLP